MFQEEEVKEVKVEEVEEAMEVDSTEVEGGGRLLSK